ncbi:MAG: hypothetical protein EYC70_11045 [Planctomycetota bacterium]|nr:MAG: hypothetical protein EYC70_11045 [Planctomycetota bacterium]
MLRTPDLRFLPWLAPAALLGGLAARWLAPQPVAAQSADSGNRYVAVSTEYQQGVGLLYVLDQKTEHLAVYEARGGAPNSHELVLVGARNISLDTQLDGFNDESEYTFKELKELFERRNLPTGEGGAESDGGRPGG